MGNAERKSSGSCEAKSGRSRSRVGSDVGASESVATRDLHNLRLFSHCFAYVTVAEQMVND